MTQQILLTSNTPFTVHREELALLPTLPESLRKSLVALAKEIQASKNWSLCPILADILSEAGADEYWNCMIHLRNTRGIVHGPIYCASVEAVLSLFGGE